jgi:putative SOS response-associated peptidase YedK
MCFHASIVSRAQQIEDRAKANFINDKVKSDFKQPHYHLNGFEHPNLPIVSQELPEKILPAVWGIAPASTNAKELDKYYKKASKFGGGLNARSEKLESHFIYKNSIKHRRCLIYVDAFFEPHHFKSKSYPYLIRRKDKDMLALGGIYTRFDNGLITCAIITKPASPFIESIHNEKKRQPVLLSKKIEKNWLEDALDSEAINEILRIDYNDNDLEAFPVSNKLHSPKEDSNRPEIMKPYNYPELSTLF